MLLLMRLRFRNSVMSVIDNIVKKFSVNDDINVICNVFIVVL